MMLRKRKINKRITLSPSQVDNKYNLRKKMRNVIYIDTSSDASISSQADSDKFQNSYILIEHEATIENDEFYSASPGNSICHRETASFDESSDYQGMSVEISIPVLEISSEAVNSSQQEANSEASEKTIQEAPGNFDINHVILSDHLPTNCIRLLDVGDGQVKVNVYAFIRSVEVYSRENGGATLKMSLVDDSLLPSHSQPSLRQCSARINYLNPDIAPSDIRTIIYNLKIRIGDIVRIHRIKSNVRNLQDTTDLLTLSGNIGGPFNMSVIIIDQDDITFKPKYSSSANYTFTDEDEIYICLARQWYKHMFSPDVPVSFQTISQSSNSPIPTTPRPDKQTVPAITNFSDIEICFSKEKEIPKIATLSVFESKSYNNLMLHILAILVPTEESNESMLIILRCWDGTRIPMPVVRIRYDSIDPEKSRVAKHNMTLLEDLDYFIDVFCYGVEWKTYIEQRVKVGDCIYMSNVHNNVCKRYLALSDPSQHPRPNNLIVFHERIGQGINLRKIGIVPRDHPQRASFIKRLNTVITMNNKNKESRVFELNDDDDQAVVDHPSKLYEQQLNSEQHEKTPPLSQTESVSYQCFSSLLEEQAVSLPISGNSHSTQNPTTAFGQISSPNSEAQPFDNLSPRTTTKPNSWIDVAANRHRDKEGDDDVPIKSSVCKIDQATVNAIDQLIANFPDRPTKEWFATDLFSEIFMKLVHFRAFPCSFVLIYESFFHQLITLQEEYNVPLFSFILKAAIAVNLDLNMLKNLLIMNVIDIN